MHATRTRAPAYARRWDEAEKALVHAVELLGSALGERHPYIGLVLLSLGEVAAARKDHLEAASCFMQVGGHACVWGGGRRRTLAM